MIPVTVIGQARKKLNLTGILDTGSVVTILPMSVFSIVIPAKAGPPTRFTSLGKAEFDVLFGVVDFLIQFERKPLRWSATVAFQDGLDKMILGDAGFLRYFITTINWPKRYSTLQPSRDLPAPEFLSPRTGGQEGPLQIAD